MKQHKTQEEFQDNPSDNAEYTRVTEILSPFSGLDRVPKAILKNAADRGTRVHKVCEGIVQGLGDWDVDTEIIGYVNSFKKWYNENRKVLALERRFYCSELMITGQVDLIIEDPSGGCIIIDLKTSSKESKTWKLQGSAYAYMARKHGFDVKGIHFIHLDRYGEPPKIYIYDDEFDLFKKCFDVYKHFWG